MLHNQVKSTTLTLKTIEIAGWLSDKEMSKGQTALWTGSEIDESCEIHEGHYFTDEQLETELIKAQEYANRLVKENNWTITPRAFIGVYENEIDE